jgi:quercetin dioxygenase-like cupin family protein
MGDLVGRAGETGPAEGSREPERVVTLTDLFQISGWQHKLPWKPFGDGVDIYRLYGRGAAGPMAALLRFHPGGRVMLHEHTGYEHIFVLAGSQVDGNSKAATGSLIINPPGTRHSVLSEHGCIVLAIYEKPVRFVDAAPEAGALTRPLHVFLAVNGTLMRGLELNPTLLAVNATFVREAATEPAYRLLSIGDRHPAMIRVKSGGVAVAVEVWSVPSDGLGAVLLNEPPGLTIGKVTLEDGSEVLGVLGEPILCEAQKEISSFGGWRAYTASLKRHSEPR